MARLVQRTRVRRSMPIKPCRQCGKKITDEVLVSKFNRCNWYHYHVECADRLHIAYRVQGV